MHEGEFLGTTLQIDRCTTCAGLWFDPGELKKATELLKSREALEVSADQLEAVGSEPFQHSRGFWNFVAPVVGTIANAAENFGHWLTSDGRFRVPDGIVLSRIADLKRGPALVLGRVLLPDNNLVSPVTRTPCASYEFTRTKIWKEWKRKWVNDDRNDNYDQDDWFSDGKYIKVLVDHYEVVNSQFPTTRFALQDGSGRVIVDPSGAELDLTPEVDGRRDDADFRKSFRMDGVPLYHEREEVYLTQDQSVYAYGEFFRTRNGTAVLQPTEDDVLLITDRRPAGLDED